MFHNLPLADLTLALALAALALAALGVGGQGTLYGPFMDGVCVCVCEFFLSGHSDTLVNSCHSCLVSLVSLV